MIIKTDRQECLAKFSAFPLREYDKKNDEEIFYYPDINAMYWLKLKADTDIQLKKKIATEIVCLYRALGIDKLTFLCDFNSTWITKNSKDRTDYKQLTKAVKYLRDKKVGLKFNGALTVIIEELKEFLEHFYILTKCDASFSYYHFIDDSESFIGYIHYDGEVRFDTLNEQANDRFLKAIKKTGFENTRRENANKI